MNIVITFIIGALGAWLCYMVALAFPFLAPYATVLALLVFLLILAGGYYNNWTIPRR